MIVHYFYINLPFFHIFSQSTTTYSCGKLACDPKFSLSRPVAIDGINIMIYLRFSSALGNTTGETDRQTTWVWRQIWENQEALGKTPGNEDLSLQYILWGRCHSVQIKPWPCNCVSLHNSHDCLPSLLWLMTYVSWAIANQNEWSSRPDNLITVWKYCCTVFNEVKIRI